MAWSDAERILGNLHRAYAYLARTAEQRGGPIDFPARWPTSPPTTAGGR